MGRTTTPKTVRAKKAHACHWCGQRIEPGELYVTYRWFNDGDAGTNKMHPECDKACECADLIVEALAAAERKGVGRE